MIEESPVLGSKHRLDEVVRHLVDRHGRSLDKAAPADNIAVAVEEGDGEIALVAPVPRRVVEGGHRQRQHQDGARRAEREALAEKLEEEPAPTADAEAAEEDGQVFPEFAEPEPPFIERCVDPCVDGEQERRSRPSPLFRLGWSGIGRPGSRSVVHARVAQTLLTPPTRGAEAAGARPRPPYGHLDYVRHSRVATRAPKAPAEDYRRAG